MISFRRLSNERNRFRCTHECSTPRRPPTDTTRPDGCGNSRLTFSRSAAKSPSTCGRQGVPGGKPMSFRTEARKRMRRLLTPSVLGLTALMMGHDTCVFGQPPPGPAPRVVVRWDARVCPWDPAPVKTRRDRGPVPLLREVSYSEPAFVRFRPKANSRKLKAGSTRVKPARGWSKVVLVTPRNRK